MNIINVSILAVIAGALMAIQAGLNFKLNQVVNNQVLAALISFIVGSIGLCVYFILFHFKIPSKQMFLSGPWWIWLGGLCGAFYIVISIISVPRLGATLMFALFLTGQLVASLFLDHCGLIGFTVVEISEWRILGVIMVLAGTLIIKYG